MLVLIMHPTFPGVFQDPSLLERVTDRVMHASDAQEAEDEMEV